MNNTKNQLNKKLVRWKNKQVWQALSQTNLKEEKTHNLVKLDIKERQPNRYQWNSDDCYNPLCNLYSNELKRLNE